MAESAGRHDRCCKKTKKGKVIYLTGNKIAKLLRKAVKKVCPTPDKLKQYFAHSLRVWACVLLNKSGKPPDYIKKRLCWLGDSFRMYLRDTAIIQHQHVNTLLAALQEVINLITALPKDTIALSTMMEGTDNPDMHRYTDKMD
jgi:nitrate reductase alpha subunit